MVNPFVILCIQTIILWLVAVALHRYKNRITLIPLYSFVATLTVLTHNFSDLGFAVTVGQWYFLIASFSFFTPLMFSVLLLYLLEGPRAARAAIWVILMTSLIYIMVVVFSGLITDINGWVVFNGTRAVYYFWSLLAIVVDMFFLAVAWEILSKIKNVSLMFRVFLVTLLVLITDTIIFTTGVFGSSEMYLTILGGNLMIRVALSAVGTLFITYFLNLEGFDEETREKPKKIWEILNFRTDLEIKIKYLEDAISIQNRLEKEIIDTQETYELAITGAGAGIWDWNVLTNDIFWSPKFCTLLEYSPGEIEGTLNGFKKLLHPEDLDKTLKIVDQCLRTGKVYETEYRLKTKNGKYFWFLANGIVKYDAKNKPIRMVGSIININDRKETEIELSKSVEDLTRLNSFMVDREVKMSSLKEEITRLNLLLK